MLGPEGVRRAGYISKRVGDWRRFHAPNERLQLAQSPADILGGGGGGGSGSNSGSSSSDSSSSSSESDSSSNNRDGDNNTRASTSASGKQTALPKMTMVDVVIIRSEERRATDKGINLLSGLTAILGGTTFAFTSTRTANDTNTGANPLINSFAYAPALTVAATYYLNIFNDNNDHNEVLDRPSLVALDGQQSEFFPALSFM